MALYDPSQIEGLNYGRSLLALANQAALLNEVGIARYDRQIFYSDDATGAGNRVVSVPSWARRFRFRLVGASGGGGSGAACTATNLAIGGGSGSTGGNFVDCADVISYLGGATSITVNLGLPGVGGAGVVGAATVVNGNVGTNGGASSITVNGVVMFFAAGGLGGDRGTSAGGAARTTTLAGGRPGGQSSAGSTNTASAGFASNTSVDTTGGGGGATGFSTSNASGAGTAGSRGAVTTRNPLETAPAPNTDAVVVLIDGIPQPGNGGGGGSSASNANGGRGVNGGGSGGSPASRTTSLKAPDGARSYAVIEWFGSEPVSGTTTFLHVLQIETSTPQSVGGVGNFTTLQFPQAPIHNPLNAWDAPTNHFVVPAGRGGRYLSTTKLRLQDEVPLMGYGMGVFTSNQDGTHFFWDTTHNEPNVPHRNAINNESIGYFNPGDRIRMFCYADNENTQTSNASWNLFYLGS